MSEPLFGFDAYSPGEIAARVERLGVIKARLPLLPMLMLAVLAGAFIGFGALFFTIVRADTSLGFATGRILGGVVFSLGLLLVVIAGAELFTGNNLFAMAWVDGKLSTRELLTNWSVVLGGNILGAVGLALLVVMSGHTSIHEGEIGNTYALIARAKVALPFVTAFASGVLCNTLVCLAVWMAIAGRSVVDKAVAIVFPISAFVAAGFEHSVANIYFFAVALLLQARGWGPATGASLSMRDVTSNLVPVILGNIVGGSLLVAFVYFVIYRRHAGR